MEERDKGRDREGGGWGGIGGVKEVRGVKGVVMGMSKVKMVYSRGDRLLVGSVVRRVD
jgi:hypothetical protein